MYISRFQYAIQLVRESNGLVEQVNRFRKIKEKSIEPKTNDEKAIGRYAGIKMNEKALVDFYDCYGQFDQEKYLQLFKKNQILIPKYLNDLYYLVVFYNDFQNVIIFNDSMKPLLHHYKTD